MPELSSSTYSATDASNTSASPDGAPEGMAPSGVNNTIRALIGSTKRFWQRIQTGGGTFGGTTNAYTITYTPALAAYVSGERYSFVANADNTGSATLNINALGAKTLRKITSAGKVALASGDIKNTQPVTVEYDGTDMVLVTPVANLSPASATTTAEGIIELATQAEANSGTDAVRALTPATLANISPGSVTLDAVNDQALILDASDSSKLKRASLGALAFQASYASAEQTITLGGSLTLAHGLASTPRVVMAYLRCATAELGYAVNQETQCMAASSSAAASGAGSHILALVPDATNINVRFPATAITIGNYTTGAASGITPGNWRLKVYAYV